MPFYHIVIADGRAPRDGKFIERIGTYNPLAIPAEINLDFDKALEWLNKGAKPSDTARAILMYKGVLFKNHLLKGVAKGALTIEQAEAKFQVWLQEKEAKAIELQNALKDESVSAQQLSLASEKAQERAREEYKVLLAQEMKQHEMEREVIARNTKHLDEECAALHQKSEGLMAQLKQTNENLQAKNKEIMDLHENLDILTIQVRKGAQLSSPAASGAPASTPRRARGSATRAKATPGVAPSVRATRS